MFCRLLTVDGRREFVFQVSPAAACYVDLPRSSIFGFVGDILAMTIQQLHRE